MGVWFFSGNVSFQREGASASGEGDGEDINYYSYSGGGVQPFGDGDEGIEYDAEDPGNPYAVTTTGDDSRERDIYWSELIATFINMYPAHTFEDVMDMPVHVFIRLLQVGQEKQKVDSAREDALWMRRQREIRQQQTGEAILKGEGQANSSLILGS